MDKNYDGGLNFKEFMMGLESLGIKLNMADHRLIFEAIDYDNEGEVNFSKFCLLNEDNQEKLRKLQQDWKENNDDKKSYVSRSSGKPPVAPKMSLAASSTKGHPLFGDGVIPKSKNINDFTKQVNSLG